MKLQHTATRCNTLQHAAALQRTPTHICQKLHYNTLQHATTRYSTRLQNCNTHIPAAAKSCTQSVMSHNESCHTMRHVTHVCTHIPAAAKTWMHWDCPCTQAVSSAVAFALCDMTHCVTWRIVWHDSLCDVTQGVTWLIVWHDSLCAMMTQCVTWLIVWHDSLFDMTHCVTWLIVWHDSLCAMTHCVPWLM